MNVLTTQGYKPIEDIVSSDDLIAYDLYTGNKIINHLNYKQKWQEYDFDGTGSIIYDEWDGNNNQTKTNIIIPNISWQFYKINNTWTLYGLESIWVNNYQVVHVSQLKIGDIIYDENDNDIIITDIQPVTSSNWWRVSISGDHSYIADGLTLHNPSRYWIGGGSSTNYNATANTNWSATSGGTVTASVPTASDDIFFDGSGSRAQDNCNLNVNSSVLSATFTNNYSGSFTASATYTLNGNFTCNPNNVFSNPAGNRFAFQTTASIATNGKTIPFGLQLNSSCFVTVSGSDLVIINNAFTGSTQGFVVAFGAAAGSINKFSNEKILVPGFGLGSTTTPRLTGNIDIYIIGGTIGGNNTGAGHQPPIFLSASLSPITISKLIFNQITYVAGPIVSASSQLIISNTGCILNTPGITYTNVNNTTNNPATLFLSSSLTASNISLTGNVNTAFTGSGGFITDTLTYYSTSATTKTLTLQAGNTYIVTGSLNIGVLESANFPNIVTSGSGGGGLARPKLILQQGATCQAAANFIQIDASGGRTINTFSGSLTNTTNIRSFTDYPTTAFSRIT